jgi:hypothetical protein
MSMRPLPGASFHTFDAFHSFDPSDLEAAAVGAGDGLSERKDFDPFHVDERKHPVDPRQIYSGPRKCRCRRPPVLLSIIVLICLAFVASAYWGNSSGRPNVPDRHTPLPIRLSSASRTKTSFETLVDEHFNGALDMMCVPGLLSTLASFSRQLIIAWESVFLHNNREQTFECAHHGCSEDVDLRRHLLQNFPLECVTIVSFDVRHVNRTRCYIFYHRNPSVRHTLVGDSAIVLHWQGTDSSLKPVLITNTDGMSQHFIFSVVLL